MEAFGNQRNDSMRAEARRLAQEVAESCASVKKRVVASENLWSLVGQAETSEKTSKRGDAHGALGKRVENCGSF